MFPSFPGFEEFPIHVKVEHEGRERPVLVRIEQLPTSPPLGTPVCSFPDAPGQGEWLLGVGKTSPYTLKSPRQLLQRFTVFHQETGQLEQGLQLYPERVQHLRDLIERALKGELQGMRVLRVVALPHLPHPPHFAFLSPFGGVWCRDWKTKVDALFDTPNFDFYAPQEAAQKWLQNQWDDLDSEVRFAWSWANWNDEERLIHSFGLRSKALELEQVLRWVFLSSSAFWQTNSRCYWTLHWRTLQNETSWYLEAKNLASWGDWLPRYFFKQVDIGRIKRHRCAREYWEYQNQPIVQIRLIEPPTMHKHLEARFALREWLQKNAPERMDLMECL